jgi:hypothetical protein
MLRLLEIRRVSHHGFVKGKIEDKPTRFTMGESQIPARE